MIAKYADTSEINLLLNALEYADGVVVRTKNIPEPIQQYLEDKDLDVLDLSDLDLDENEDELKKRMLATFGEPAPSN